LGSQRCLATQAEALEEHYQVIGHQHHLKPHLVGHEAVEGEVGQPGLLGATDTVLDAGVSGA
jgi:hypothetical protein